LPQPEDRLEQIAERVWILRHDWKRLEPTVGLILTDEGWLAVDGGNSPAHGRLAYEAAQGIERRPFRYVIDTHRHFDHAFGNQAFDAPVIGSRRCRERFARNLRDDWAAERVHGWLREEMLPHVPALSLDDFDGLALVPPSLDFEGRLRLHLGGTEIELFHLDGVHCDDHLAVYLPDARVLFPGDAFYYLGGVEGSVLRLPELLARVSALDVATYAAGHERPYDQNTFERLSAYARALVTRAEALAREGMDEAEVLAAFPFDTDYAGVSFLDAKTHRRLLRACLRALSHRADPEA